MTTPIRPRIGVLPMVQEFYKAAFPGIDARQQSFAETVVQGFAEDADIVMGPPAATREDADAAFRRFRSEEVDGIVVLMTTYAPAMFVARGLLGAGVPILIANTQPERTVTGAWTLSEMCHNQGVHGAQDIANTLVRGEREFESVTGDWRDPEFGARISRWARACAAVRVWSRLRLAVFGYALDGMGDLRVDEHAFLRVLGPSVTAISTGDLVRARDAVSEDRITAALAEEDARFAIDPELTEETRRAHLALQLGLEDYLEAGGYGAFSAHFGAITDDGRIPLLPLAAASALMSKGYGYSAEGDAPAAAMVTAGHTLIGDAHFTEMFAMDFDRGTVLMSHLGEGNYTLARDDEPVRLIRREIGFGPEGDGASFMFWLAPGPATIASLVSSGDTFRIVVAEGEIVDTERAPELRMPSGHFRPDSGLEACLDGWMRAGGTHHQALNRGHHAEQWAAFGRMLGIEVVRV